MIMIGSEMKLDIPVHYQMGNPLAIYKVIHTSNYDGHISNYAS
jgi:hypothetical protein